MSISLPRSPLGTHSPHEAETRGTLRPANLRRALVVLVLSAALTLILGCFIARAQMTDAAPKTDNAPAGNVQNGKRIFDAQACNQCHGSQGQGLPNQEDAAPRIGPTRLSQSLFVSFVRNPTGRMPPYASKAVGDTELADLYAFLQSTAPAPQAAISSANAQNGRRLYSSYGCYECHGHEGQGSAQTGGSRIGPVRIPFPAFVAYIRQPTGQMPPYTGKAVSDAVLADIYVYLQSLPESAPAKTIPLLNQ